MELSSETLDHEKYWKYLLNQPQHVVLSVGGTDWIHLKHHQQSIHESIPKELLFVEGFSFHTHEWEKIVPHVLKYMKEHYDKQEVALIIQEPLTMFFDDHTQLTTETQHQQWTFYDAHYMYMYNYKLNTQKVHIPYTMHRDFSSTF